jgi:hypothetical protein
MTCAAKSSPLRLALLALLSLVLISCSLFDTTPLTRHIALGDLDGDADLDAFFANGESDGIQPNAVWINHGSGVFQDSGQALGMSDSYQIALGDLDEDGDLDAIEAGWGLIYLNDGKGAFSIMNPGNGPVEGSFTRHTSLGDLDNDGDLDMLAAGCCGAFSGHENDPWVAMPASTVEINAGTGRFSQAQLLTNQSCPAGALGDLDGDGDLDAFLACWVVIEHSGTPADDPGLFDGTVQAYQGPYTERKGAPNRVYFNTGSGQMLDSGQSLGAAESYALALGDLDGDGDLDALLGNLDGAEIWLNQGGAQGGMPGQFALSDQRIDNRFVHSVELGDVDGDGDLDALLEVASRRGYTPQLWLNDGHAAFTRHTQNLEIPAMQAYALGDVDNDGDLDIFAGSFERGYEIWFNNGKGSYVRKK